MATYVITVQWTRPNLSTLWVLDPVQVNALTHELSLIANLSAGDGSGLSFENVWTFDETVKPSWESITANYSAVTAAENQYRTDNGLTKVHTTTLDGVVVPNF
jgi:hypothetical protein